MKKHTIIYLTTLILTAGMTTNIAYAQRGTGGPPPMPTETQIAAMIEEVDEALVLSERQKTSISELYYVHFEEVTALMEDGRPSQDAMDAIRSDFESKIQAELSDEQFEKFEELQKTNRPQQRRRR